MIEHLTDHMAFWRFIVERFGPRSSSVQDRLMAIEQRELFYYTRAHPHCVTGPHPC